MAEILGGLNVTLSIISGAYQVGLCTPREVRNVTCEVAHDSLQSAILNTSDESRHAMFIERCVIAFRD